MTNIAFTLLTILGSLIAGKSDVPSRQGIIVKQQMQVSWQASEGRVHFELTAPVTGWMAIGLNTSDELTGTYLLMARVVEGQPEVVEHKVIAPGVYRPFQELDTSTAVTDIHGSEKEGITIVSFSLPEMKISPLALPIHEGQDYTLLMAYSISDDFQHHSIMRTLETIQF
jgi:hypothetical protein